MHAKLIDLIYDVLIMKFFYRFKVKEKIYQMIRTSTIENYSNDYLNSLIEAEKKLPSHVNFYLLVQDTYLECLEDHITTLKNNVPNELHAAIFVITKVFQNQSQRPNSHQEMRKQGILGELMSEAFISMFIIAQESLRQDPSLIDVFNQPNQSIFDDIKKAREYSKIDF